MQRKVSKKKPALQGPPAVDYPPCISAAHTIINAFQTPTQFVEFMSEALWVNWWARSEPQHITTTPDPFIVLNNFMNYTTCAWVGGGNDVVQKIAEAVEVLSDEWDGRSIQTDFFTTFSCWAIFSAVSGCRSVAADVAKFTALIEVSEQIRFHQFPNLKSDTK